MYENQKLTEAAIQEARINGMAQINQLQQELLELKEKNKLLTQETQQFYEIQQQALLDKWSTYERQQELAYANQLNMMKINNAEQEQYVKDKTTHVNNITNEAVNGVRSIGEAGRALSNTLSGSKVRTGGVLNSNMDNKVPNLFSDQGLHGPANDVGKPAPGGDAPVHAPVARPRENPFKVAQQQPQQQKPPFITPNPQLVQGINNLTIQKEDLKAIQNNEPGPCDFRAVQRGSRLIKLIDDYKAIIEESKKYNLPQFPGTDKLPPNVQEVLVPAFNAIQKFPANGKQVLSNILELAWKYDNANLPERFVKSRKQTLSNLFNGIG
ncbi:hypothetical protein TRFO_18818 [Tritrichomonas foetus]|uniref:Uncharacterized protein n=1 Tax=Tritrichomonas foetus TaxID=1144522 RepID=A0A1J4KQL1_9EUKA|nr:hypothetical protein TRFO_18818 [Tritrichomonas foetus]|eukprot:OHT11733.1 hypothetical protein TRFO_18818 [Tritrichomonas foetus]